MEESYVDLLRAGGIYRITISVLKHNHTLTPHPDSVTAHMPYEAVGGRLFLWGQWWCYLLNMAAKFVMLGWGMYGCGGLQ